MIINVEQAKEQLDSLIDRSTAGEDICITRNGRLVARVVPAHTDGEELDASEGNGHAHTPSNEPRVPGWGKGIITHIAPDFDEPLEDFREYMQ